MEIKYSRNVVQEISRILSWSGQKESLFSPIITSREPIRVAVDIRRMVVGGENGGVKILLYKLFGRLGELYGNRFQFTYIIDRQIYPEVATLLRRKDNCYIPQDNVVKSNNQEVNLRAGFCLNGLPSWLRPDVVYSAFQKSDYLQMGVPSLCLLVDLLHRDSPSHLANEEVYVRECDMKAIVRCSTSIQCNSNYVRERLKYWYPEYKGRAITVYNPTQGLYHKTISQAGALSGPYFVYPANDWPHKNHVILLQAYAKYANVLPNPWSLVLTGHLSNKQRLFELVEKLGIGWGVKHTGYLNNDQFKDIFRSASALIFPSFYEGFGIPILEAMGLGVPVLCSNVASLPEVAGEGAIYFNPYKVEDIALAMFNISTNKLLHEKTREAGLVQFKKFNFDYEVSKVADELEYIAKAGFGKCI